MKCHQKNPRIPKHLGPHQPIPDEPELIMAGLLLESPTWGPSDSTSLNFKDADTDWAFVCNCHMMAYNSQDALKEHNR